MSNLSDFTGGTSVIKSIQRGSTTVDSESTVTVTIADVDLSKSILSTSVKNGTQSEIGDSTNPWVAAVSVSAGVALTASNTLTVYGGGSRITGPGSTYDLSDVSATVYWEVIEYA